MLRISALFVVAAMSITFVGCASGGGGSSTAADSDTAGASDTAASSDAASSDATGGDASGAASDVPTADLGATSDSVTAPLDGGALPADAGPGQDGGPTDPPPPSESWEYPEGPYGKNKFDIIADLPFYDPWEDRWVYLHEYHMDPSKKMLVLIAGAGWCSACRLEAEHLVEYYDEYEADGLGILYTLYQDNDGKQIFTPGEDATANMAFMNSWKNAYAVDYPLVADIGFTLESYFTDSSTPLTMVIRTEDMLIKYVDQGYSSTFLDYQILMNLYN